MMGYAQALADFPRDQAEWRREVAERHDDSASRSTARGFDRAATEIEAIADDHPWISTLVAAGWLTADGFQAEGGPADRYLRQFNRYEAMSWEDLLFSLAMFAGGDDVWLSYANSLRGRAAKFDLILTPLRRQDTHRPQWESYSLRTRMGTNRVEQDTLLGLDRYLTSLETARDTRKP
ncbi:MAG: hypothetical protein CVT62_11775 [Actinobacteria bacterium HGW-Actinobacteria-2]|nr:MAG: hypothetical protein CVT62_11775 [Actinobacteria bacterium HGW-Actinobacteria-2]